jgi:hypothetical protein
MTDQTAYLPHFRTLYVPSGRPAENLLPRAKSLVGDIDRVLTAPDELDPAWFREFPHRIRDEGFRIIELVTVGEWLGDGDPPDAAMVSDHVACHRPNPLTGSPEAAIGRAFVDMRGAYLRQEERAGIPEVVVWHTTEMSGIAKEESDMAKSAGCKASSPYVAPWAVGVVAAGMGFRAYLLF